MKSLAVILPLSGWGLLAFGLLHGWPVAFVGSVIWIALGIRMGDPAIVIMNGAFAAIQTVAMIRIAASIG